MKSNAHKTDFFFEALSVLKSVVQQLAVNGIIVKHWLPLATAWTG